MADWTPQELADVVAMTPRQFEAAHPGAHSPAAIHIKRRLLRDHGVDCARSEIGRIPDPVVMLPELPASPTEEMLWGAYDAMYEAKLVFDESKALSDVVIPIETMRPFGVVFMSDFHIGSAGVDTKALREDVELINTCPHLKAYVGGDGIDNFVLTGLANVHRDTAIVSIDLQMELFKSIVRRLLNGGSLLAVGSGNHDAWTKKVAGIDANLAALAGVPCLHTGEQSYLTLRFNDERDYVIYRKHRPVRATQFNQGHGVQHAWRWGDRPFDIGVTEHHHTPHMGTFYGHNKICWAITTGSYKIRDGHAAEFGFVNGGVGTPVIIFNPLRRAMIPFMSIPDAIDYLEAYRD